MASYGSMESAESTALLQDSIDVNDESCEIGEAALGRMQEQRGQLLKATHTADDTRRITRDARGTMREMAWRIITEKAVLISCIVMLLGIDGGLAYLLIKNGGSFKKR
ncbi:hypothetical protein M885DRAFT_621534 [Pelagophyceae sp. CCMP2097]|nr:hypothetical protein M885DRAFT_621534 [Pelagophyceae sp. CCMP2097]